MADTPAMSFEQVLRRDGDDLYRLAILLAPDPGTAGEALVRTARRFQHVASVDARVVAAVIMEHLPVEHTPFRRQAIPAWARSPVDRPDVAPVLAAVARLPRAQRLALGMAALRSFEPAEHDPGRDPASLARRGAVRDALLALAPDLAPDADLDAFDAEQAPETCRATRAAIVLGEAVAHADPAVRGHLALCESCRAVARDWRNIATRAEYTVRDALRTVRLSDELAARVLAAATPDTRSPVRRFLAGPWARRALLPLAVLVLVALLVWPRRNPEAGGVVAPVPSLPLSELVTRAEQSLYVPAPGEGIWRGSYLIRWTFADQTYANLRGDLWIDRDRGQHRVQLVHQQGGGPYEFQLFDRNGQAWYALTPAYGAPSGGTVDRDAPLRIWIMAAPEIQPRLLQARLNSGAWAVPRAYLLQARSAELRSWGRRQSDDGAQLEVIGFRGTSLLGLPPDAPGAGDAGATILLAIDVTSGTLREIRELVGPVDGEQVSRMVWMYEGGREVDARDEIATFSIAFAWNGEGTFVERQGIAAPEFPLIAPDQVIPFEHTPGAAFLLPDPPPGTTAALLSSAASNGGYVVTYHGPGRRLSITIEQGSRRRPLEPLRGPDVEQAMAGAYPVTLLPGPGWRYQASVNLTQQWPGYVAQVRAQGYTRAELLATLASLDRMTPERYRAQAALFAG